MAIRISDLDRAVINDVWSRLLVSLNMVTSVKLGDVIQDSQPVTGQNMTLWVDGTNGDDANDGKAESRAFKTLTKALMVVPFSWKHVTTVKVKAGTYAETLQIAGLTVEDLAGKLIIEGQDWAAPTLTTGAASGTVTANSGRSVTVAGADWTVNELRGKFVKPASGSLASRYLPIASNTNNTITFAVTAIATAMNGVAFTIVEPAAVITRTASDTRGVYVHMGARPSQGPTSTSAAVEFRNMKFSPGGGNITGMQIGAASVYMKSCSFVGNHWFALRIQQAAGALYATDCFFEADTTCIMINWGLSYIDQSVISGYNLLGWNGVISTWSPSCWVNKSVIQGCTNPNGGGVLCYGGYTAVWETLIRESTNGLYLNQNAQVYLASASLFDGLTGDGIKITDAEMAVIDVQGSDIKNCAGSAIRVNGHHTNIRLNGNCVFTGNTGWGVHLAGSSAAAFNGLRVSATADISGNTAGDMTNDGSTNTTLAGLKAAAGNVVVDATRFNRLYSDE